MQRKETRDYHIARTILVDVVQHILSVLLVCVVYYVLYHMHMYAACTEKLSSLPHAHARRLRRNKLHSLMCDRVRPVPCLVSMCGMHTAYACICTVALYALTTLFTQQHHIYTPTCAPRNATQPTQATHNNNSNETQQKNTMHTTDRTERAFRPAVRAAVAWLWALGSKTFFTLYPHTHARITFVTTFVGNHGRRRDPERNEWDRDRRLLAGRQPASCGSR